MTDYKQLGANAFWELFADLGEMDLMSVIEVLPFCDDELLDDAERIDQLKEGYMNEYNKLKNGAMEW